MFSFLKNLEALMERLKRNRVLWFTTLTVVSTLGIFISMYIIGTMTSSTAEEVYKKEGYKFTKLYNNITKDRYNFLFAMGNVVAESPEILNAVARNNLEAANNLAVNYQKSIAKTEDYRNIKVTIYLKTGYNEEEDPEAIGLVILQNQDISGVSVEKDGVYIKSLTPIVSGENVIGAVEVKQSFSSLKDFFENFDSEFAFTLKNDYLENLSLEERNDKYISLSDQYSVKKEAYASNFYTNAFLHEISDYMNNGYQKDEHYFTVAVKVYDLKGQQVGVSFVGVSSKSADSFVQQTKSLTNSVTTVALGLVISMLLFMF